MASAGLVISLDNVGLQHGSQILYAGASLGLFRGEKVGLVGPNGAGKSTIFRLIMREEEPDAGTVTIDRGLTIGYFDQNVGEMAGRTVLAEVVAGAGEVSELGSELAELEEAMGDPERADELDALVERYGDVQPRFQELGGFELETRAHEILAGLGFRPEVIDNDVAELSGGWKMRVALARILLMRPQVLLLDEPTNHLDIESILWLERFLKSYRGAIMMTSHDREFLNRLVTKIIAIDDGKLTTYSGDFGYFKFPQPPRSGKDVAVLKDVCKAYGGNVIYDKLDFSVRGQERWCVMGVNGSGKSTLLKIVAEQSKADAGSVKIGASVKMGYFAQDAMELLNPERTVFEEVQDAFPTASQGALRTLLGAFGFSGDDADKSCSVLSGGERVRLILARMLYDPPNFLVLDEPTNHLDLDTKAMLIRALADYEGTMLFVSHDRQFLAQTSNRVLELGDDGARVYEGGYTEYVESSHYEAPGMRE